MILVYGYEQDKVDYFKHYPFNIYIYIILTEIIIIYNCHGVTATQLTTFVHLYSCNNITLKMTAIVAETSWWECSE